MPEVNPSDYMNITNVSMNIQTWTYNIAYWNYTVSIA